MIEIYVALTLLGVGFLVNQKKKPSLLERPKSACIKNVKEVPSMKNTYESTYHQHVKSTEFDAVKKANVQGVRSLLSGVEVNQKDFTHNNMTPYFRGNMKQNTDPNANNGMFERFGVGVAEIKRKTEMKGMFVPETNVNVFDDTSLDSVRDRMVGSKIKNNVLPFDQVRVGRGLDQGYNGDPVGGFQQVNMRDYVKPKTIDDLRVGGNPKVTFEGRVVDGQKGKNRGVVGEVVQNKQSTFFENNPDRYFKTTGAYTKDKQRPEFEVKETNRLNPQPYTGGAFANEKGSEQRPAVQNPLRNILKNFQNANLSLVGIGKGARDDHGKASVQVYGNERDVTTTRVHKSNITTLVKAFVAPMQDIMKHGRKEYMVDNGREYGHLSAQIPTKQSVRDPNDVVRTTIKQTLIHDEVAGMTNMRGPTKLTVYDPNDVTRTTIKQTTLNDIQNANIRGGAFKSTVYDPNDVTRTTVKQTTIHDSEAANVRSTAYKSKVYDPSDVTRTTIKQTTIHDSEAANVRSTAYKSTVYDPNDVTRTTVKQTTIHDSDNANIRSTAYKPTVYDPNDVLRTTVKQTTIHDSENANIRSAAFKSTVYDPNAIARVTIKETWLHDAQPTNLRNQETRGAAYDLDAKARSTIRQTTDAVDTTLNFSSQTVHKGTVYDPTDYARKTVKETILDEGRIGGALAPTLGATIDGNFDVKITQKGIHGGEEHFGGAQMGTGDAYSIANFEEDFKDTLKQNPEEYYGGAATQQAAAHSTYEDMHNATCNGLRESTLVENHSPTLSGVKIGGNVTEGVNLAVRKMAVSEATDHHVDRVATRVTNQLMQSNQGMVTRERQLYDGDRMDLEILEPFKRNPYTHPLNSSF
jgi:hypothetical protein